MRPQSVRPWTHPLRLCCSVYTSKCNVCHTSNRPLRSRFLPADHADHLPKFTKKCLICITNLFSRLSNPVSGAPVTGYQKTARCSRRGGGSESCSQSYSEQIPSFPSSLAGAPVTGYQVDYALQPPRGREREAPWQTAYHGPELSCKATPPRPMTLLQKLLYVSTWTTSIDQQPAELRHAHTLQALTSSDNFAAQTPSSIIDPFRGPDTTAVRIQCRWRSCGMADYICCGAGQQTRAAAGRGARPPPSPQHPQPPRRRQRLPSARFAAL